MNNLLLKLRSILFYLGYMVSIVIISTIGILLFRFASYEVRCKFILIWNRFVIFWLKITCGVRYQVFGAENLPKQPYVALSKHQSQWETVFLQAFLFPVSFVLKRELLSVPFFGWALRLTKPIAINRSNPKQSLKQILQDGQKRLGEGISVLIFPEGTRIEPGQPSKYARGGANIAVAAKVPVVPIAVNAGYCWPSKGYIKYPGKITVNIGKPINTTELTSREITEQAEQWIEAEMAAMSRV
jgi:1-acyl-sn-glycerol-3-phosphate acyltransferase